MEAGTYLTCNVDTIYDIVSKQISRQKKHFISVLKNLQGISLIQTVAAL